MSADVYTDQLLGTVYHGATAGTVKTEYNDTIKVSPQVLIANLFGFAEHTFFSAPEEKAPMPEFEVTDVE